MTRPLKLFRRRQAPACIFPIRNEITGNIVWFEVIPSGYGVAIIVHKEQPLEDTSPETTAMVAVHVDYFVTFPEEQEQIKLQLWDEHAGPYGDPGWNIPTDYSSQRDASIVLVENVQEWKALADPASPRVPRDEAGKPFLNEDNP